MELGEKLRQLRGSISQTKLAQELEVSQTAYNKWESGISKPKTTHLLKISNYYKINLFDLMGVEAKINFYDSEVEVKNLINENKVINQTFSEKLIPLYEKRISDLENELVFWKTRNTAN